MLSSDGATQRERRLSEVIRREGRRLRRFIRSRVANETDVEDILQDVFSEFVEFDGLVESVRQVSAWLFRVARNRIIDRYRKHQPETLPVDADENGEMRGEFLEDWLPSPDAGPEAAYARGILMEELVAALAELPSDQREVFVAHELEGRSFRDLANETGLSVNTLLSRKHHAVLHLRDRLRSIYLEYVTP
jgi:RNA polymerase sigma factor (sigma-70 family)